VVDKVIINLTRLASKQWLHAPVEVLAAVGVVATRSNLPRSQSWTTKCQFLKASTIMCSSA
jgi:predicted Zn-dependent protease